MRLSTESTLSAGACSSYCTAGVAWLHVGDAATSRLMLTTSAPSEAPLVGSVSPIVFASTDRALGAVPTVPIYQAHSDARDQSMRTFFCVP
jgi:hypothetical protein